MKNDQLMDWAELSEQNWGTLLVGNGLSMNLWQGFGYSRLLDACHVDDAVRTVFEQLGTANFEQVLEALNTAHTVLAAMEADHDNVDGAYETVKNALFDAVIESHVPWTKFPVSAHRVVAEEVNRFRSVFSTSYDLCIYWSVVYMKDTLPGLETKDFMFDGENFNPSDTGVKRGATRMFFPHGGLHLWHDDSTGTSGKWRRASSPSGKSGKSRPLLKIRDEYTARNTRRPLFVSEGTHEAKLRAILRSPYLTFCLDELRDDSRNTVVFGHSLSDADCHIVEALADGPERTVAVALRPSRDSALLQAQMHEIRGKLVGHTVEFFDSTTHPLGSPELTIT